MGCPDISSYQSTDTISTIQMYRVFHTCILIIVDKCVVSLWNAHFRSVLEK